MAKSQIRQYVFNPTGTTGGTIVVPGKIDLQQLLIITNTTTNNILYNFADVTYSGTTVSFNRGAVDNNFNSSLDNTDGVTIITIPSTISTAGMTGTNALQIFFEQTFQYVRSPEVGTDAFERQRVANPQSMIDADFEYGMQPTKWLTISQQRGYPAIYEIPGTDITVTAATTDASSGSGGYVTSESIITITTQLPHGYSVGQPITISGFNSAITGFERAQGSFIVFTVPSTTTFTYISKGKVGFVNGDNIFTPFIQVRKGGFYTGASINSVINATIIGTNGSTNYITVSSTQNMTAGSALSVNTVQTNAVATNASTNYITLGTTVGLTVGMPLVFTGTSFGGLSIGTYYVVQIVDTRTVTISNSTNLTPVFTPTTTVTNGNMNVTGGASFGGVAAGTQYYIGSVVDGTRITLSNNIIYTTTVTSTNATNNAVYFGTTANMTVGETVIITGTTMGNITAATYYVVQILDSNYVTLASSPTGTAITLTNASGSMSAQVGVPISLTAGTSSGFLWAVTVAPPTVTYSTPATVATFTGSITTNVLSASAVTGTLAIGQGISGTGVSSATVITGQLTATNSASAITTLTSGGAAGAFTFVVLSTTNILPGQLVSGSNVPAGTFVAQINNTTITLTQAFTSGGGSGNYSFFTIGQAGTYSLNNSSGTASSAACVAVAGQPTITVNTVSPHGFIPGDTINMYVTSENGSNNHTLCTGPFFVETVSTNSLNGFNVANQLTFTVRGVGIITGTVVSQLYARPDSFFQHRPFDGGVQLGTGLPAYGSQAIRMSKKYIRYQSGKGINFNTGLLMAPNYYVRAVYANSTTYTTGLTITNITTTGVATINLGTYVQGQAVIVTGTLTTTTGFTTGTYYVLTGGTNVTSITLATSMANVVSNTPASFVSTGAVTGSSVTLASLIQIVTDDVDHGCQVGATINLSGVITSGYNGTYTVAGIIDERQVQVIATQTLGSTLAVITDPCLLSLQNWWGAVVRSGTYDEQNGTFWQYDGQTISVVRRSSTFQLAGTISVIVGSGQIIGANTKFTTQLFVGDRIVIRGMSHVITQVASDTLMYVNPQFRGYANLSGIKATKTIDYVIPQSKWNGDRCDGSNSPFNPSGYQINPIKMQMVGMQWTWYGAGFIDWMLRGPDGKYITCHRLRNNNLNNEAWMRSGNMPVRYEVQNEAAKTYTVGTQQMGVTDTVMTVNDTSVFPTPNVTIPGGSPITLYIDNEFIQYTAKISTTATAITGGNTITVGSTTNMAVGQPIVFMQAQSLSMGGIVSGQTYYINSIGTNTITLANNSNLTSPVTGLTSYTYNPYGASTTNYYMTINAFICSARGSNIIPWATGGYRTFSAGNAATHNPLTGVLLVNGAASPIVSHWGAAFIEDGGFDSDRSYIFNYSQPNVNISTKKTTAFAVRLAPSVSNALTGDLGGRELINRASFLLQTLESCAGTSSNSNTAIVIEGILNPSNYPALTNIQWASLSSVTNPTGQPSFSQVAPGSTMVFTGAANIYTTVSGSNLVAGQLTMTVASTTGIQIGDDIFFPGVTNACQGLTKVTSIVSSTITFSYALVNGVTSGQVVLFSRSTYALPGETVFSYVNSPANKDSLDLTSFKELTNTPIGGRGTYPNGCDVLFINAYITQGAPLNQNLILRWGEAQA